MTSPFLPVAVRKIRVLQRVPLHLRIRCYSCVSSSSDATEMHGDILLFNEQGTLLVEMREVVFQQLSRDSSENENIPQNEQQWMYQQKWVHLQDDTTLLQSSNECEYVVVCGCPPSSLDS